MKSFLLAFLSSPFPSYDYELLFFLVFDFWDVLGMGDFACYGVFEEQHPKMGAGLEWRSILELFFFFLLLVLREENWASGECIGGYHISVCDGMAEH